MTTRAHSAVAARLLRCALALCWAASGTAWADDWPGFRDASRELETGRYSFRGTNPDAGTNNENYYDGDMGDLDGDRLPDRIMGSRYGMLHNQGGGQMVVARRQLGFLLRGDPGARRFGDDAAQLADIDGDGDLDAIMGGNGELLVAQLNSAGRFSIGWIESDVSASALDIINTDIEGDGDVDLVVAHSFCEGRACGGPVTLSLYVNDGTGRFSEEGLARGLAYGSRAFVVDLASGDVDRDGDFDLIVAHGAKRRLEVALNDGTGHFEIVPTSLPTACSGFGQSLNLGDVDDDGDLDIAYGRCGGPYRNGHPKLISVLGLNDGRGRFRDVSASYWDLSSYTGGRRFIESPQAKLMDVDHDGDLDFIGFHKSRQAAMMQLVIMRNRGDGRMRYDPAHSFDVRGPDTGLGADVDITDLDGDGSYDAWLGMSGGDVRILLNRYASPDGLPADVPRSLRVLAALPGGIEIGWRAPPFAATARGYRVYRALAPGLDGADRELIAQVGFSAHQDEGFSAPITRHTTSEELGDPNVVLDGAQSALRFTDRTALPGIEYHYAVAHVGTENTQSAQTQSVSARIAAPETDRTGPLLHIADPKPQTWSRWPRIALHYGDDLSGVDPSSLHVSFDAPIGDLESNTNLVGLAYRHDGGAFVAYLDAEHALPLDRLVTLTARVSDRSGKQSVERVRFFVAVDAPRPPKAVLRAIPGDGYAIDFSGAASADPDGLVVAWEWYFGDGTTACGRAVRKTYAATGEYTVRLRVRDNEGGVDVAERVVSVRGNIADRLHELLPFD